MLLVLVLAAIAVQVWAWRQVQQHILTGRVGRVGGVLQFGGWAFVPVVAWVAGFFGLVGAEELTGIALIPEPAGRAMLPMTAALLVLGMVAWVAFVMVVMRARQ
jgi:hypothetical protein